MAGTTTKGLRYPSAGDNPAVHTDIQNLATDVDTELNDYALLAGATFTGAVTFNGEVNFEGSTANGFETTLAVVDPTADRTVTFADVSGTVVTTGNLTAITTLTSPTISNATFTGQQSGLQVAFNDALVFEGTTADAYELTLSAGEPTADRVITLPDTTDTLATLTDVNTAIAEAKMNLLMLGGM
jgi:hypothetical protein